MKKKIHKENERLKASMINADGPDGWRTKRIRKLEADLAVAKEALEKIAYPQSEGQYLVLMKVAFEALQHLNAGKGERI